MGAVSFRFRAEARRRLVAWAALGLVAGVGIGAVLASVAGARRTTDAYDRFAATHDALDAVVSPDAGCDFEQCDIGKVEELNSVSESVRIAVAFVNGWRRVGNPEPEVDRGFIVAGAVDGRLGTDIERWRIVDGRAPNPDTSAEVALGEPLAARLGLSVGDEIEIELAPGFDSAAQAVTLTFTVAGIVLSPSEFDPTTGTPLSLIHVTPALITQRPELFVEVLGVRLRGGAASRPAFVQEIAEFGFVNDPTVDSVRLSAAAREQFRDDAAALMVFATVGAILTVVLVGQAMHRQQVLDSYEDERLKALGFARSDLHRLNLLRTTFIATATVLFATLTAIALSPLSPVGEARDVEPDPGVAVDWVVLGIGALTTFAALTLLGIASGGRILRHVATTRLTTASAPLGQRLLPWLPVRLGAALAFDGRRRGVPLASVVTGIALAAVSVVGASTFTSSLAHLRTTPALYGAPWDDVLVIEDPAPYLISEEERAVVAEASGLGDQDEPSPEFRELIEETIPRRAAQALGDDEDIAATSLGFTGTIVVGPLAQIESLALKPVSGSLEPTIIEGRLPRTPDEIALGGRLLDELGLSVGDDVEVVTRAGASIRRIVGRSVSTVLGEYDLLGGGAIEADYVGEPQIFVRFNPDVDEAALHERLQAQYGAFSVSGPAVSSWETLDLDGMESAPQLIVALTAFLGGATLLHFGFAAARRHARQLALLRAMGSRRRDIVLVLMWNSGLVVFAAILVGAPIGYIAGRVAWLATAEGLYVKPVATLPSLWAAASLLLGIGIALATAATAGAVRTRGSPAIALRSE